MKWLLRNPIGLGGIVGALVGGLVFAAEAMSVSTQAAGLHIDTEGPLGELMRVVRPQIPVLAGKILLVYLLGFGAIGIASAMLARCFSPRRFALWFAAEFFVLTTYVVWSHGVSRPALFDDLPFLAPVFKIWVEHGKPWHAHFALALSLLLHGVVFARRVRLEKADWRVAGWAGAALAVALLMAWQPPVPSTRAPLMVLIGIDALRPDRLYAAPKLRQFVAEATEFRKAYTPIAQTEPAWRSLLTARWPHRAGSRYPLTAEARWPKAPTFAEVLTQHGFKTYFETDCSRFNYQDETSGFTLRRQPPRGAINFVLEKFRFRAVGLFADNAPGAWWLPELVDNRAIAGIYDPRGYAERLAARVVNSAGEDPVFFAFHATAAHFPGDPVYPFYRQFVRSDAPAHRKVRMMFSPVGDRSEASGDWTSKDASALYDELIAQADMQFGVIVQALKKANLYESATIIVFSDHGESFHDDMPKLSGATPVHGARLSDEENHIFLAMKPSGKVLPKPVDDRLVRLIDIGPTFLEVAGVSPLPSADGVSLNQETDRLLYAETGFTHVSPGALNPHHRSEVPRSLDAYRIRPDGVVEVNDVTHHALIAEKDVGVFDGQHWLIQKPLDDGTVSETCDGQCEELRQFLHSVQQEKP